MTRWFLPLLMSGLVLMAADSAVHTIVMVRHADKLNPTGDTVLNKKGQARARLLAETLRDAKVSRIFYSPFIRMRQTGKPISELTGVKPVEISADELDKLVAELRRGEPGATTLVIHHSNTIPDIVKKLGGGAIPPIPESEYDRMLVVTVPPAGGGTHVVTLRYGAN